MPRLSQLAAHLIYPTTIRTSEFPAVQQIAARLGVRFSPWQVGFGTLALGKRADGQFACSSDGVVASLPRQVGKTFLLTYLVVGESMLHPHNMTLWTAHVTRTADETFRSMSGLARGALSPWIRKVWSGAGNQEIDFKNGSRVLFGARERGFGRGLAHVDLEVFDEAQILGERALDDMLPAENASDHALTIYIGTPPKPSDDSAIFAAKRATALTHPSPGLLYLEFSADPDANVDDRRQWRKANPAYPSMVPETAMLRLKNSLSTASFRREGLGIWDANTVQAAIKPADWAAGTVTQVPVGNATESFGVDMSPDRAMLTIVGVRLFDDGRVYAEVVDRRRTAEAGTRWCVDWLADHWDRASAVAVDQYSPASTLVDGLRDRGIQATVTKTRELAQGCGMVLDAVRARQLYHPPRDKQTALWRAVDVATVRDMGKQGLFAFNRPNADSDISPLVALSVALYAGRTSHRDPTRVQEIMV